MGAPQFGNKKGSAPAKIDSPLPFADRVVIRSFALIDVSKATAQGDRVRVEFEPCAANLYGTIPLPRNPKYPSMAGVKDQRDRVKLQCQRGFGFNLARISSAIYRRKGYAIATDEQLERISRVPKREFRRRGINQHTLERICMGKPVHAIKLTICLKILAECEAEAQLECNEFESSNASFQPI